MKLSLSILELRKFISFVIKTFLYLLFSLLFFLSSSFVSTDSEAQTKDEQLWIKTTTNSLTVDWNFKKPPVSPAIKIRLSPDKEEEKFWQGTITGEMVGSVIRFDLKGLSPKLWYPSSPELYRLELSLKDGSELIQNSTYRIGFRNFETRDGKIFLNGKPIFLRGIAINPPGRGIPDKVETSRKFATEYIRFLKSINVNIIRIPDNSTWYDVCLEAPGLCRICDKTNCTHY